MKRGARDGGPVWRDGDGKPLACHEKIKVLNENIAEIRQLTQDAFEDAILMGGAESQFRQVMHEMIDSLDNPYRKTKKKT